MVKVIDFAHSLIARATTKLDTTIDCTMGKGKDTLFLSSFSNKVYSFDIQDEALKQTEKLLKSNGVTNVELIKDSHVNLKKYVSEYVTGVIFNLGYLPDGDKTITTKAEDSLKAILDSLTLLKIGGVCCVVIYPGHPEGAKESELLDTELRKLDQKKYDCLKYDFINWKNKPAYLIAIRRLKF